MIASRVLIASCVVLGGLGAAAPARAEPLPPDFFGVYSEDAFEARDAARSVTLNGQRAVGFGIVRLPLDWSTIQPDPDRWNWAAHDEFVLDAARAGMRVLPFIVQTPGWAREPEHHDAAGIWPPQFPDYVVDFAAAAARRYGRAGTIWRENPEVPYVPIRSWQIWNEPNLRSFWRSGPDPVAYTRLLESAAYGIRSGDPDAEIVSAGLPDPAGVRIPAPRFVAEMYDAGAARALDTVAVHPYAHAPEEVVEHVADITRVVARHGDDAPVWATEFGWATGGSSGYLTDEEGQARQLARAVTLLGAQRKHLRLRGLATYNWRDSVGPGWMAHAGLRRLDNSPKPAQFAIRAAMAELRAQTDPGARGGPEPPGEPGHAGGAREAAPAPAAWGMRIFGRRRLRPARSGRVALEVRCGSTAVLFCTGSVWLEAAPHRPGRARAPARLGSAPFRARTGRRARVHVRLTSTARAQLRQTRKLRVIVRAGGTDLLGRDVEASVKLWLTRPRGAG